MAYVPRLTAPLQGNKYFISTAGGGYNKCIERRGHWVLPNCPGYAYGRFMEIGGVKQCKLSTHNAGLWWGNTADGYSRGKTPKLGAVICWSKGSEPGHVAIVEKINSDGTIVTSESGYSAKKDFWTQTRNNKNGNWGQSAAYGFQGFIYNPFVEGGSLADDPQSEFVNYAKGKLGTKYYSSMQFIKESAKKAGILGELIPDVLCATDIGTDYKTSQGSIVLGPANGYLNKPEAGDIALIRTDQNRQFLSTTSCDMAGIVYSVSGTTMQILELSDTLKVILKTYSTSSKMIAGYFHPKWITVQSSSLSSDLTFTVSAQLYDSQNTKEDAIVREVAYFDGKGVSKTWSGIRLSVTNYTTMLASLVNSTPSAAPTNLSASSQTYLTSGMKNQNARVILEFLVGKGLMESQAIGFLANIQMESGFLPSAVNKSSGASGICQWFQSRRTAMINFVGSNWKNNLTGQCEYLWHELNTTEKGTLTKLRDKITKNTMEAAEDATILVLYTFERPGRNEEAEERRKGYARDLWKQLIPQLKTV